jgi:AraC-like DNA-binding protein
VGTLGYAALSCKTIRQVTEEIWGLYGSTFGMIGEIRISADSANRQVADVFAPRQSEAVYRFNIEEVLTFFLKNGAFATGVHPPLERLEFSYPAPSYIKRYDETFRCAIKFEASQTRAIFRGEWFDLPLRTYDVEFNRLCIEHLSKTMRQVQSGESIATRIRELLTQRQETSFSLNSVALDLGIGPRTLERQLQQEGFSYRKLVEEVRLQLAQGWIARDQLAPKEMSYRLGFSDVSTFRRAFKSWTGKTIQEYASTISHSKY